MDAMLVFDASGSMAQSSDDGRSRIDIAREAATQILPSLSQHRRVGLLTFGPGQSDQCSNIAIRVPVQTRASARILSEIAVITTDGGTPLSSSIEAAATALDARDQPAVIVVVTDGDETCDRDPCEVARTLHHNFPLLTVHVIMFDALASGKVSCFASETNGRFVAAKELTELSNALRESLECPLAAVQRKVQLTQR